MVRIRKPEGSGLEALGLQGLKGWDAGRRELGRLQFGLLSCDFKLMETQAVAVAADRILWVCFEPEGLIVIYK